MRDVSFDSCAARLCCRGIDEIAVPSVAMGRPELQLGFANRSRPRPLLHTPTHPRTMLSRSSQKTAQVCADPRRAHWTATCTTRWLTA
jgi:hypothetical protein